MYIKYNGDNYPCFCRPTAADIKISRLPADFPTPVSGEIVLYADDGFEMRTVVVEDYLRQTFDNGVLVLTNIPEPELVEPDTTPSLSERVTTLEETTSADSTLLKAQVEALTEQNAMLEECIIEMAMTVYA